MRQEQPENVAPNAGNTLILFNSIPYFLKFFNKEGVTGSFIYKKIPFALKVIRKITRILNISQEQWFGSWYKNIKSYDLIIVFAPVSRTEIFSLIRKQNPSAKIIYWYWNPYSRIKKIDQSFLKNTEIWSFDPEDCARYDFKFNTTFYFKDITLPENRIEYDVLFIGLDKGRQNLLEDISKRINGKGLKAYINIIPDKNNKIPYSEYLKFVSKSKVILDIVADGQSGLTVRVMESIFHEKKLITTDETIINHDFYREENIFIWGQDNVEDLKRFIDTPFTPLPKSVKEEYDVRGWIRRFSR